MTRETVVDPRQEILRTAARLFQQRGVGQATLSRLGDVAQARHISLFAAVFEPSLAALIPDRQNAALGAFCALINGLRYRAEREPAGRLLNELLKQTGYCDWLTSTLDRRDAQARTQSVDDFVHIGICFVFILHQLR